MKNKIFLLTFILFLSSIQLGYGKDVLSMEGLVSTNFTDEDSDFLNRNPFKSWLPKIEEKIEKELEKTKIDTNDTRPQIIPVPKPVEQKGEVKPIIEPKPPEIKISGLVWSTDRPQAIINNQIFVIGDMIGDSKIVDINKEGVDIIFLNKLYTIKIEQNLTQSI